MKIGDIIEFGKYPQKADGTVLPLKWRVLDRKDNTALVITEYGIDSQPYHHQANLVTWETCSLREWLNQEFFAKAFTPEEQSMICLTKVINSKKQGCAKFKPPGGNDMQDKIFCLSYQEAFMNYHV